MKQIMHAVNIRDPQTKEFKSLPALMGPSAYEIAKSKGGYIGSEEEFARLQAAFANAYERNVTGSKESVERIDGVLPINADLLQGKAASSFVERTDVLTLEEIEASTSLEGKVASAQAVNKLNSDTLALKVVRGGYIENCNQFGGFNSSIKIGFFNPSTIGIPMHDIYGIIICYGSPDVGWYQQIATETINGDMYSRILSNNTWTSWIKISIKS